MNPEPALPILARGIVKTYGSLRAVDGLDLELAAGRCLGLLGPNGAGKTTTIEILEGLTRPDAGEIRILGLGWDQDAQRIRERIGVQLQETRFPDKLTVFEVLRLFASFYRDARSPDRVATWVGLEEKRRTRTVHLSGGQRQRLALGCALVNRPDILFLDEPTTGLDPQARRRVWEIVEEFKDGGGAVLLTTHYMDEAEKVSDELIIMDHGKAIARGTPRSVIDSLGAENILSFRLENGARGPAADTFASLPGVVATREEVGTYLLTAREAHHTVSALYERLKKEGLALASLETHRPTLEDVFVSLTGRRLRDE